MVAYDAASSHPHGHALVVYRDFPRYAARFIGNVDGQDGIVIRSRSGFDGNDLRSAV